MTTTLEQLASAAVSQNVTSIPAPSPTPAPTPAAPPASYNAGPDDTVPMNQPSPTSFADAAAKAAETASEPAPAAWVEHLKQAGIDATGYKSPEDLALAFVKQQQEMKTLQPYAQYGQQFLPYAQHFGEIIRKQVNPEPQAQQPAEPPKSREERLREHWSKIWQRPNYDPSWDQLVTRDENGHYVGVHPHVPAHIIEGVNQYRTWQAKALQDLLANPFEQNWKALEPGIQDVVKEVVQQELNNYRVSTDFESLDRQYESVLYEHDDRGNRVIDPVTGQYRWTPLGEFTVNRMQYLRNAGMTDPYTIFQTALESAKAYLFDQSQQQQQAPVGSQSPPPPVAAAVPTQPQVPSMYTAPATPAAASAPQQSFLDRARNIATHGGSLGGAASPSGPETPAVQSFDNEGFFSRAAAQMGLLHPAA